ncbi:hypothetical protein E4U42_008059 [Claviceps africana]|uniref:Alpha/beta hydrolase fold-3 domain-containing protein n=1 Tax=Claviceps africana TaxID=83212 RepID=A0A8K0NI39_9HYPO|nr:hypothetical protein E4U42_008059 [Claviceps africana]
MVMNIETMNRPPRLSVLETLDLFAALGAVLFSALAALVNGPWRAPDDEASLYLYVAYAATRKLLCRFSAAQLRVTYRQQAKAMQMTPRTIELPHGVRGNWIGDPDAKHLTIHFDNPQGGGFSMPAVDGHFKFMMRFIKSRPSTKPSLSIFFPEYTLTPAARYPTQLTQAVEALRYLVVTTRRSPSSIMLGGDSAGGNLVAGVLAHLTHPHEAVEELVLTEPLAGAVMVAPWIAIHKPDPRLAGDGAKDIILKPALDTFARNYMGAAASDYFTDPCRAPAEWFRGMPVKRILVMAGQYEYLLPSIDAFVKTLQAGYGPVEFYVAEKEVHDAPFVNLLCCHNAPTRQGTKLVDWIEDGIA